MFFGFCVVLIGCAQGAEIHSNRISVCSKTEIETAMQRLYDVGLDEISKIDKFAEHEHFATPCPGRLDAKTPLGGPFTKSRYPEISFPFQVDYRIYHKDGICIVRTTRPESSGAYSNCYK